MIAIVSLWTPLSHPAVAARWFSLPNIVFFAPVPILVLLATWAILRTLRQDSHAAPFLFALFLLFLGYSGLAISLWPNIIPPSISIWDAAALPKVWVSRWWGHSSLSHSFSPTPHGPIMSFAAR